MWRTKEAFSDGVSSDKRSWFETIQDNIPHFDDGSFDWESLTQSSKNSRNKNTIDLYLRDIIQEEGQRYSLISGCLDSQMLPTVVQANIKHLQRISKKIDFIF